MQLPAWNDPDLKDGVMVRGGLWLIQVIGTGNTFTKEQLRLAFPGVSQADRRVRDLRKFGWTILTSTEDATLLAEEQRFVRAGVPVWDPAARRAATPQNTLSAKDVKAILVRDSHMCTSCGISGAEAYPDDPTQTGVLSVTRRTTLMPDGSEQTLLVTECKRCRAGSDDSSAQAGEVLAAIESLDNDDRRRLMRWMSRDRRIVSQMERVWSSYRLLPADARDELRSHLGI